MIFPFPAYHILAGFFLEFQKTSAFGFLALLLLGVKRDLRIPASKGVRRLSGPVRIPASKGSITNGTCLAQVRFRYIVSSGFVMLCHHPSKHFLQTQGFVILCHHPSKHFVQFFREYEGTSQQA